MNLQDLDHATLLASPELDVFVAEGMGWEAKVFSAPNISDSPCCHIRDDDGEWRPWSPSTDPAHAGEARRKAGQYGLETYRRRIGKEIRVVGIRCWFYRGVGECLFSETDNDPGRAEALTTTRAIVAARQANDLLQAV